MNDYLWDKSGEPDPAIERLEELLGSRRYDGEPLRLPSEAVVAAPRRSYGFGFYTRRVAAASVAAGLTLAMIGGVWLNRLRDSAANTDSALRTVSTSRMTMRGEEIAGAPLQSGGNPSHAQFKPEVDDPIEGARISLPRHRSRAAFGTTKDKSKVLIVRTTPETSMRRERTHATTQTAQVRGAMPSGGAYNAGIASRMRQIDEQRNAKEQLMFALRLTSTKLSVARDKTQTAPAGEADAKAR